VAVRLRVRVEDRLGSGCALEAVAVANAGFESDEPVCLLPVAAAAALGWWPSAPRTAVGHTYRSYAGDAQVLRVPEALAIRVATADRAAEPVRCTAVITTTDNEVNLNDVLVGDLAIVLVDTRRGLWCFRDEPMLPGRPSEPPQIW
jgi:hypothetical protein